MKAQVSVEYLMVLGSLLFMALPAGYLFYHYSDSTQDQLSYAQLEVFADTLVNTAARVYYMGEPSRLTIEGHLPDNIDRINFTTDWANGGSQIIFYSTSKSGKKYEYIYKSKINLNGSYFPTDSESGVKKVTLEAYKKADGTFFVFANFGGRCPPSTLYDLNNDCVIGTPDRDLAVSCIGQRRSNGTWNDRWNACIGADYDGDCIVEASDDIDLWDQHLAEHPNENPCPLDIPPVCNDHVCNGNENCASCPTDCGCSYPGSFCKIDHCQPCGFVDLECCNGIQCYSTFNAKCNSLLNKCEACGHLNEQCCDAAPLCSEGSCLSGVCGYPPGTCGDGTCSPSAETCLNCTLDCCTGSTETCANNDNTLVGYWSFDTDARDYSGEGNHGTNNGASILGSHLGSNYYQFDGGSDNVNVPNSASLQISGPMTVEAWINPASAQECCGISPCNAGIMAKASSTLGWSWQLRYGGDRGCYLGLQVNTGSSGRWSTIGQTLAINTWHHVAFVYDGGKIMAYLNGNKVNESYGVSGISSSSAPLYIGDEGWGNNFNGLIDEVKVFNRALSQTEIQKEIGTTRNTCVSCGALGLPCCEASDCPTSGTCIGGICTVACGSIGQSCCASSDCPTSGVCNIINGKCEACGGTGQPCCVGETCGVATNVCSLRTASLVGDWSFDDGSGFTAQDSSSFNNDAAVYGASWTPSGIVNGGLSFDGINDYALVPYSSSWYATSGFTESAWVKPKPAYGSGSWPWILYRPAFINFVAPSDGRIEVKTYIGGVDRYIESTNQIPVNTWTHVAFSYDGNTRKLYINGALNAQSSAYTGPIDNDPYDLWIGGTDVFYNGTMDEVKVWKKVLSDQEVGNEYKYPSKGTCVACGEVGQPCCSGATPCATGACTAGVCVSACGSTGQICCSGDSCNAGNACWSVGSGLEGYWKFDASSGVSMADSSGKSHTGTMALLNPQHCASVLGVVDCNLTGGKYKTGSGWISDSHSGNALRFDGNRSFVDLGYAPSRGIGLGINASAATFEAWIKTVDNRRTEMMIVSQVGASNTRNYEFYVQNGQLRFMAASGGATTSFGATGTVSDGSWKHVAFVENFPNYYFYVNGVQMGSGTMPFSINSTTAGSSYTIGGISSTYPDTMFNGSIDSVKVWRRALSPSEIQAEATDTQICVPASPTLFENYLDFSGMRDDNLLGRYWNAQTFTPSTTHRVTKVQLYLANPSSPTNPTRAWGDVVVSIRATDGSGLPTGDDLATGSVQASVLGDWYPIDTMTWVSFDLGAGYVLNAGTKYAIVVRAPMATRNIYYRSSANQGYNGGQTYDSTDSGATWSVYAWDMDFREMGFS
jgi:hypothetical protein